MEQIDDRSRSDKTTIKAAHDNRVGKDHHCYPPGYVQHFKKKEKKRKTIV